MDEDAQHCEQDHAEIAPEIGPVRCCEQNAQMRPSTELPGGWCRAGPTPHEVGCFRLTGDERGRQRHQERHDEVEQFVSVTNSTTLPIAAPPIEVTPSATARARWSLSSRR